MTYEEYKKCRRPYQEYGHYFLLDRKHACLFYKPGKGKTYPCIDALRDVDASKKYQAKVLILSTADTIRNMWQAEIEPQNILPRNTVMFTFNSAITNKNILTLTNIKWDVIIVDECHKVKAYSSKISKLVHRLSRDTEYVWGLTGTPRGNNDLDIFNQFHNLYIASWGDVNESFFKFQVCACEQKFFGGRIFTVPIGIRDEYKLGWEKNIAMFTQRIDYSEDDDMPDLKVNTIKIPFVKNDRYELAEQGVISISDYETTMTKLVAIQKLHQIANGFIYADDGMGNRETIDIEPCKKLDWIVENLTKDPTMIVYRFGQDLRNLCNKLDEAKISYTEDIDTFKKGNTNVLLLQCCRCESFNMQMCHRIIFYTLDYSFIKYNQMLHRVWRMGQKEDVQIDVLIMNGSVEESIWDVIQRKEELSNLFMRIKGDIV